MSTSEEQSAWSRPPGVPQHLLDRAEKAYEQTLAAVWIANGAAAITSLQFIHDKAESKLAIAALSCFFLGLVALGLGTITYLVREKSRLERFELSQSPLSTGMSDIQSKAANIGLTLKGRTMGALIGAGFFVLGSVLGLAALVCSTD